MSRLLAASLTLLLTAGRADSKTVAANDGIALGKFDDMPAITRMNVSDDGATACLVGSFLKNESDSHSVLILVDLAHKKTSWVQTIAPPANNANVYAVGCGFQGNDVFVLANANRSSSAMATNPTLVYVIQFSRAGARLRHAPIPSKAKSDHAVDLLSDNGLLTAVGYTKNEDVDNEYYATFITTVDSSMGLPTTIDKDGGYSQFSALRIVGGQLYAGGRFFPKMALRTDALQDYANSRIKSDGRYLWSVRPVHKHGQHPGEVQTAINAGGTIYSVAQVKGVTSVITVGQNGKIAGSSSYKSAHCNIDSLAAEGGWLVAVRAPCGSVKGTRALVVIDPAGGHEKTFASLPGSPRYVTTHKQQWFGVFEDKSMLTLHVGTLGSP